MRRITSRLTRVLVVTLLCTATVTAVSQERPTVIDLNALAARGEAIANQDPLSLELRNRQPDDPSRLGFDIGMAAAEGQTLPGPGKQKIHDSLPPAEQRGFNIAVSFSLERNRNAKLAAIGAAIAKVDERVAAARTAEDDVFYWLGFDIATGIFGDPAQGAQGNTATGPGSLKIRDSLSPAGQRGFNASVKLHLGQAPPSTTPERRPQALGEVTSIDDFRDDSRKWILQKFIQDVRVRPDDTRDVVISFTSTQNSPPLIEIGKVAPAPDPHGILAFPAGSGAFSRFVPGQNGKYALNIGTLNDPLDVGATYYYIINVFNDDKNNTKRPREQVMGTFTPLTQAQPDAIRPPIGGGGGGQFIARCPRGQLLGGVELRTVDDVDAIRPLCVTAHGPAEVGPPVPGGIWFGGNGGGPRQLVCPKELPIVMGMSVRAQGVHTVVVDQLILDCGIAATTQVVEGIGILRFEEHNLNYAYQHPGRSFLGLGLFGPDHVPEAAGFHRCVAGLVGVGINGRSGVWLDAVGLICGSPELIPAPAPDPRPTVKPLGRVKPDKPLGRVKVEAPSGPPRPICDVAREARARNSPAAPGLEKMCRADLATKGATIAQVDPIVAEARAAETDVLYREGFDIATGIFGDPALGAQGNTATGPGSLGIRDSLSAAGQRGFNASVELHLSRKYKP